MEWTSIIEWKRHSSSWEEESIWGIEYIHLSVISISILFKVWRASTVHSYKIFIYSMFGNPNPSPAFETQAHLLSSMWSWKVCKHTPPCTHSFLTYVKFAVALFPVYFQKVQSAGQSGYFFSFLPMEIFLYVTWKISDYPGEHLQGAGSVNSLHNWLILKLKIRFVTFCCTICRGVDLARRVP